MRIYLYCLFFAAACCFSACSSGPSRLDQYHADKHVRDSIGLADQERTLAYFQTQLDSLLPIADSLLPLFKYEEKNPKYQDHGYYVATGPNALRILVRDDGDDLLIYRQGKRIDPAQCKENDLYLRAVHLRIVMSDIAELERRIHQTQLQITKYRSRLLRNP